MAQNLDKFTPAQRKAILHHEGPALVISGPGSGKTHTATNRIAYLIENRGVKPSEIVAVTFTNKAAREMKERVGKLVSEAAAQRITVSTFHSMCARILRKNAESAGLSKNFTICDDEATKQYITQAVALELKKAPKEVKSWKTAEGPGCCAYFITTAKQNLQTPEDIRQEMMEAAGATQLQQYYLRIYERYESTLARNNSVDFDDLIMKTVRMFKEHSSILEKYAKGIKQILVDEWQDTNASQYELIRMLSSRWHNVMVIGDGDQSIYAFRGANYRNLSKFETDHKDTITTYYLEENFRSTPQIAEVANSIIKNNVDRPVKQIIATKPDGAQVRVIGTLDPKQEAAVIMDEIRTSVRLGKSRYQDYAILYRTHARSRALEEVAIANNIPHRVIGGLGFYNRAVVKDLLSYLKLISNPADEASFTRIYDRPTRGFGDMCYSKVHDLMERYNLPIMEVFVQKKYEEELKGVKREAADKIRVMYEKVQAIPKEKVGLLLESVLRESGYLYMLQMEAEEKDRQRLEHAKELVSAAYEYDRDHGNGLDRYLEWTSLMQGADDKEENQDKVTLLTCHAAKGLEFPRVFVVGAVDEVFPIIRTEDDYGRLKSEEQIQSDMEEERRVFFVALTRAEQQLTITHFREMLRGKAVVACEPSPFLQELGNSPKVIDYADTPVGSHMLSRLQRGPQRGWQ